MTGFPLLIVESLVFHFKTYRFLQFPDAESHYSVGRLPGQNSDVTKGFHCFGVFCNPAHGSVCASMTCSDYKVVTIRSLKWAVSAVVTWRNWTARSTLQARTATAMWSCGPPTAPVRGTERVADIYPNGNGQPHNMVPAAGKIVYECCGGSSLAASWWFSTPGFLT